MFAATFAVSPSLSESLSTAKLRRSAASSINQTLTYMQRDLVSQLRKTYAYQGKVTDTFRQVKAASGAFPVGFIQVMYRPIGLHQFPYRYTRPSQPVYAKILQANGWRQVRGKSGYGAWKMHSSQKLFTRNQRATWLNSRQRAPYRALYAPSVSQMVNNPKVWQPAVTFGLRNLRTYVGKSYD